MYNNNGEQRQGGPHENGLKPMSAFAVSGADGICILQEYHHFLGELNAWPRR